MPDNPPTLTVLTRDADSNRAWAAALSARAIETYDLPCLSYAITALTPSQKKILENLDEIQWLVFTSARGVKYFAEHIEHISFDRRRLASVRIAAIGRTTADALRARGLMTAFSPSRPDAAALARELTGVKNHRVVVITSTQSDHLLRDKLVKRGADLVELTLYATNAIESPDAHYQSLLSSGQIGRVIFASPSAVHAYLERLTKSLRPAALRVPAVAIGQTTSAALVQLGFTDVQAAASPSVDQVVKLIHLQMK